MAKLIQTIYKNGFLFHTCTIIVLFTTKYLLNPCFKKPANIDPYALY